MNLIPRRLRRSKYDPQQPIAAIKRAMIEQGAIEAELDVEPEVVANLYASLALMVANAPNYSEASLTVAPKGVVDGYTVTVQRPDGKSPHQLRRETEGENQQLRDALVAVHQHLPYGDPFEAARIVDDALRSWGAA